MVTTRQREKEQLRVRIDDLMATLHWIEMVRPKLYYKLLPHLQAMRQELKPSWKRWFKNDR